MSRLQSSQPLTFWLLTIAVTVTAFFIGVLRHMPKPAAPAIKYVDASGKEIPSHVIAAREAEARAFRAWDDAAQNRRARVEYDAKIDRQNSGSAPRNRYTLSGDAADDWMAQGKKHCYNRTYYSDSYGEFDCMQQWRNHTDLK